MWARSTRPLRPPFLPFQWFFAGMEGTRAKGLLIRHGCRVVGHLWSDPKTVPDRRDGETVRHLGGMPHLIMTSSKWDTWGGSRKLSGAGLRRFLCHDLVAVLLSVRRLREAFHVTSVRDCCLPGNGPIGAVSRRRDPCPRTAWG